MYGCRVMVDHPGVGPNYKDYAAVDKEFADFMACRSTKGLAPPSKGTLRISATTTHTAAWLSSEHHKRQQM
jgi:hypothetical protein